MPLYAKERILLYLFHSITFIPVTVCMCWNMLSLNMAWMLLVAIRLKVEKRGMTKLGAWKKTQNSKEIVTDNHMENTWLCFFQIAEKNNFLIFFLLRIYCTIPSHRCTPGPGWQSAVPAYHVESTACMLQSEDGIF